MYSIVVPCYNEEKNLPLIISAFSEAIGTRQDIELILVNNGSTDQSADFFNKPLPAFAKTVAVFPNQGYGFGILSGLKVASGNYLGWTHADMQTHPRDVIKAFAMVPGENALLKGSRKNRPLRARALTVGMGLFESLLFQNWIYEINAQPTVFARSFFEKWQNPPKDFSLDLYAYVMAKRLRLKVIHFPVLFPERIHGESSWSYSLSAKWRTILRTITYSLKLRVRFLCE